MSDDNIVDFGKALTESKSNNAITIEERVINCMKSENCGCMYCNYRNGAATMLIEFLSRDMINFENNANASMCTFDLKDILFKAIMEIKKMEKEPVE